MVCDGARYLAALAVVVHHGLAYFYGAEYRALSRQAAYTNLGTLGVAVFFILSGFLISHTIGRKRGQDRDYDFTAYGVERFVRIYLVLVPAFCLAMAANGLNAFWIHDTVPGMEYLTWWHSLLTLAMLSGVPPWSGHQEIPALFGPAWTINYEFFAYALVGALLLPILAGRPWRDRLCRALVIGGVGCLAMRLPDAAYLFATWGLGALLAWVYQAAGARPGAGWAAFTIGAVLLFLALGSEDYRWQRYLLSGALAALFYAFLALVPRARPRLAQCLAGAAAFSYSLYLTHLPLTWLYRHCALRRGLYAYDENDAAKFLAFAGCLVAANAFAFAFAYVTERHTNRVRAWVLARRPR